MQSGCWKRVPVLGESPHSPVHPAVQPGAHAIIFEYRACGSTTGQPIHFFISLPVSAQSDGGCRVARSHRVSGAVRASGRHWGESHRQENRWRFCVGNATSSRVPAYRQIADASNVPMTQ
jgi:hypothetical protein